MSHHNTISYHLSPLSTYLHYISYLLGALLVVPLGLQLRLERDEAVGVGVLRVRSFLQTEGCRGESELKRTASALKGVL